MDTDLGKRFNLVPWMVSIRTTGIMLTAATGLVNGTTKMRAAALALLAATNSASSLITGPSVEKHKSILPAAEVFNQFLVLQTLARTKMERLL